MLKKSIARNLGKDSASPAAGREKSECLMSHSGDDQKTGSLSRRDLISRIGRRSASQLQAVGAAVEREKDAETSGTLREHSRDEIRRLLENLSAQNTASFKNRRKE